MRPGRCKTGLCSRRRTDGSVDFLSPVRARRAARNIRKVDREAACPNSTSFGRGGGNTRDGVPAWPEWFTEEQVVEARSNAQKWQALYQQKPSAESGDYFKAEWLKPYTEAPDRKTLRIYGASDYATTSQGGDYTVHLVVGMDPTGAMYLLDVWRKQTASDEWIEAFCDLVIKWKPMAWAEETGQIKSSLGPFLDRRQRERRAYCVRDAFPTRGDKAVRAQSIRGRMALEALYVPVYAPWYPDFRAELLSFPFGRHDDQADALGLVGQLLDKMLSGPTLRLVEKPRVDRWDRERDDDAKYTWKTF